MPVLIFDFRIYDFPRHGFTTFEKCAAALQFGVERNWLLNLGFMVAFSCYRLGGFSSRVWRSGRGQVSGAKAAKNCTMYAF